MVSLGSSTSGALLQNVRGSPSTRASALARTSFEAGVVVVRSNGSDRVRSAVASGRARKDPERVGV